MKNRLAILICALLSASAACSAQLRKVPYEFEQWLEQPMFRHATVAFELKDLTTGDTVYCWDEQRSVQPASVMKLVTTGVALRKLGADAIVLDTVCCIDSTAVPLPELVGYNPDWLIEDVNTSYMQALTIVPDVGLPMREYVAKTNQESLNANAEYLAYLLGGTNKVADGLDSIKSYWKNLGLEVDALRMFDACGLAPNDRLTAHFVIQLLEEMQHDEDFRNSLAVAGRTGTVNLFLNKTRLEGKAQLKTGTTKSVVAYVGYVQGSDGHTYALALIVNNYLSLLPQVRKNVEKLLLLLIP